MSKPTESVIPKISKRYSYAPIVEGVMLSLLVGISIWVSLEIIYRLSRRAMEGEIKEGLDRQVSVVARMLDGKLGDQHKLFTPEKVALPPESLPEVVALEDQLDSADNVYKGWELRLAKDKDFRAWRDPMLKSPEYLEWAGRMEKVRLAAKDTRYLYTNVKIGERIYFGANMTPQGDADNDGTLDEPPSLLWPYPDHVPALAKALETGTSHVTPEPYTDIWGTYYSGYAPFYDSENKLVGTIGMDLQLTSFEKRMLPIQKAVHISTGVGVVLAMVCGSMVYFFRARVARITRQLEADRLLLAQANAEIKDLNEKLQGENLRMGSELDVTRRLQMLTLPKEEELKGAARELDIAAFLRPANEVGGDYYDLLKDEDRVRIGIGDVTGHGLESGVVMLMAQTAMRTLTDAGSSAISVVLPAVNRTLYRQIARMGCDRNMTLSLLDYHAGKVTVCGQHEEVIVVRANGEIERMDTGSLGFYVGMVESIDDMVGTAEFALELGDVLVLYTDGIPEAADIENILYGVDRMCEVVRDARSLSADAIKDLVIEDVERHMGKQTMFDDITLVICKRVAVV